jgi:phage terminase large subunit GpA-like protein
VVLVTAAQSGKTETFLDIIGERLDNRPTPIIYVGPSKEFVSDQFEPRLSELFRQAPSLGRKVLGGVDGKRQKKTLKRVNGTRIRLAHAGSSTALKSDPAAFALVDEYDEMVRNVKGQGDPLGLVEARGDTYADFTVGVVSTPSMGMIEIERDPDSGLEFWKVAEGIDIQSPIWRLWQEGTRHHWCWPCPHCSDYFVPRFALMQWPKQATPAQARRESFLKCPNCGGVIEEHHKTRMNARGVYVAPGQRVDRESRVTGEPPDSSTLSFWVSGLASPFVSFGQRVENYLTAFRSNESAKIQTAINSQFGEVYVDGSGDVPPWEMIYENRQGYAPETVPDQVRYLTFGCDVQGNRLIYVIRGWGFRATSWLIKNGELMGNTAEPDVWMALHDLLTTPIDDHLIKLAFIDSGFRPGKPQGVPVNRVYEFCRRHRRFAFPTKGSSHVMLRPIVKSVIEVTQQGKAASYGLELMRLDSNHWKSFVHERLRWPADQAGAWHLHSDVSEDYCRQLVAEARVMTPSGKPQWVQRSRENHYLDAEAMAAAAGYMLNVQHLRGGATSSPHATAQGAEPVVDAMPSPEPRPVPPPPAAIAKKNRFADIASRLNQ